MSTNTMSISTLTRTQGGVRPVTRAFAGVDFAGWRGIDKHQGAEAGLKAANAGVSPNRHYPAHTHVTTAAAKATAAKATKTMSQVPTSSPPRAPR